MLRCMCGVTKKDKIRDEHVRGSVKVAPGDKEDHRKETEWNTDTKQAEILL